MIDTFILLTPILLLGIIALLGFTGCNQVYGIGEPHLAIQVASISPTTGPTEGGTQVTISGANFGNSATVTFDGLPATNVVVGTNHVTIIADTPAHASGYVDVVVTSGNSAILPSGFKYAAVTHLITLPALNNDSATGLSRSVNLAAFPGDGKLIMVMVQWGGAATVSLTGANFTLLTSNNLQPQQVLIFYASNITSAITVTATLSAASSTNFNMFVTAYDNADQNAPPDAQAAAQGTGVNLSVPFATDILNISEDDLIYAVAVTRDSGFVLNGTLGAGPAFTAENSATGILIEDHALTGADIPPSQNQIIVTATNTAGTATSKWFIVPLRIKHQ